MRFSAKTIAIMLIVLAGLNVIDAFATLYFVSNGFAREVNPLMEKWLEMGPAPFLFIKLFLNSLGIGVLWVYRKIKIVHTVTALLLILYIFIACMHINIALSVLYISDFSTFITN